MKRPDLSQLSVPDVSVPDVSLPTRSDLDHWVDSLGDLAETAADAVSSAAGHVPGLHDVRASNRRRNVLLTILAIVAVVGLVAYLKRRSDSDDTTPQPIS